MSKKPYDSSTDKILQQQSDSLFSTKPWEETQTQKDVDRYYFDDFSVYDELVDSLDSSSDAEMQHAEYLIEKMESDPSQVSKVAAYESVSVITEIIRQLLLR